MMLIRLAVFNYEVIKGCLAASQISLDSKKVKYKSMQERSNISLCKISVP